MRRKISWRSLAIRTLWIFLIFATFCKSNPESQEYKLIQTLLTNYSASVRPVKNSSQPVNVTFEFRLVKIVKLDIKEQEIVLNARILMRWNDPSLVWDKALNNNMENLNIPMSNIWTPDVLLYNTASEESQDQSDVYKANVMVKNTGRVTWMSPVTLRASCVIDVKWFPFDQQSCDLTFGSISLTVSKLGLNFLNKPGSVSEVRSEKFYSSGIWSLTALTASMLERSYICCDEPFSLINYNITLDRLSLYWVLYLILPCLCLSAVSICVFFIPPETGERISYCITVVLSISVYLLVISDKLPEKGDNKPLLGLMYIVLFMIMIMILISVIFTTHLAFKVTKPPEKLRHLFCQPWYYLRNRKKSADKIGPFNKSSTAETSIDNDHEMDTLEENQPRRDEAARFSPVHRRPNLKHALSLLSQVDEQEFKYQEQWRDIAERLDRIFFWLFLLITVLAPFVIVGIYAI